MKKTLTIMLTAAIALASINCTTTYDAYGNPRNSVDPGTAVAGAAAVGVLGYALAKDRNKGRRNDAYRSGYYNGRSDGYYDHRGHYRRY